MVPGGPGVFSIFGGAEQEAASIWQTKEACLGESRGVIQVACSQPDPVPSYPPSLRKLRPAGCPGEVTQLGSLAESGLIRPRSPVPQLPGCQGLKAHEDWAGPNHSWTPTALGAETWTPSILRWQLWGPSDHCWAAQSSVLPDRGGKGHFPRRASPPGVPRLRPVRKPSS